MSSEKRIKWHIVFDQLSKALFDFYEDCRARNVSPGEELFARLQRHEEFMQYHSWIHKFSAEFGVRSVDPFHVFASINSNKSPYKNRTIRTKALLNFFKVKYDFEEIDFDGCPAPRMIRLLSVRKPKSQTEIWEFFSRVYSNNSAGLQESDFDNYKKWYGIELSSFTIFLFWIRSDYFLPIEKNTRTFLRALRVIMIPTKDYQSYITLIELISRYNQDYDSNIYFAKGLFREVTHTAYNSVTKGVTSQTYSPNLKSFLSQAPPPSYRPQEDESLQGDETGINEVSLTVESIVEEIKRISELGFNIIALTPLDGCGEDHLNILTKNQVYHFEKTIIVTGNSITYHKENYFPFYNTVQDADEEIGDGPTINVTAIVGKNGSGKSTLIELLFKIINNITFNFKDQLHTTDIQQVPEIEAELFYVASGVLFSIHVKETKISIQQYFLNGDTFEKNGDQRPFTFQDFGNFFYTIAINYSHYALNSIYLDDWIDELFHKNDSYQTPLVINPMRTGGNININVENDLVRYRLLANLFIPMVDESDLGIRQVTDKQVATRIDFQFISDKNKVLYRKYPEGREVTVLFSQLQNNVDDILKEVAEVFDVSFDGAITEQENADVIAEAKKYIVRKLVKISVNYPIYEDYFNPETIKLEEGEPLKEYLNRLKDNRSHITYKLRQAINYFKYSTLYAKTKSFQLDVIKHTIGMDNYRSNSEDDDLKTTDIIELLPPPIFEPIIWLKNEDGIESKFDKLSSGEKQFIHTVGSILYHINNIDSVNYSNNDLVIYRNVNILMDEIELYYHPELQREYLFKALAMLNLLSVPNIDAINICFVTHSPFILSDIPNTNILFLGTDGLPDPRAELETTFGANIHDMLKHSFFLSKGTIGEVAKSTIQKLTKYLQQPLEDDPTDTFWNQDKASLLISKVGEPIIRERLNILFDRKFHSEDKGSILRRIAALQAELNR